ncbi:MAG: hypothetical protein L3J24_03110 [Xanthomonadales bacterium]|nr:hypothetical protein [Xanthomonadales bacterium]
MTEIILKLEDSRRLTGPNLFSAEAGAIIDISCANIDPETVLTHWNRQVRLLLDGLGWAAEKTYSRVYSGGISLVVSAPIDALYAATEVNEAAWQLTMEEILTPAENHSTSVDIEKLQQLIHDESNPPLLALQKAAMEHNICFLSDDDEASIGYGKTCQIFPVKQIPPVNSIDWGSIECIPVALVTGTNGKSTTVRLASAVAKAADLAAGITSTDYIRVGDQILDTGDYSGPGGARTLLRHPNTQIAFLEVARGGMLRRGIGVNKASSVLITNVAEDHLGEYGINTLNDMVAAKFIVRQAISLQQGLILNADDTGCVSFAKSLENKIVWFSWSLNNPVIQAYIQAGGDVCYVDAGIIYSHRGGITVEVIAVKDIPITLSAAAKHNTHNALAVTALCLTMGIDVKHIRQGLSGFASTPENNPGRGNVFEFNGITAIVDFAHNEHGLNSMVETISNMPATRRLILISQAGDRSDELIKGLVASSMKAKPDALVVCELASYLRGRELNEVPRLIRQKALDMGMEKEKIMLSDSPFQGVEKALEWAQSGDVLLILALTHREEIIDLLSEKVNSQAIAK